MIDTIFFDWGGVIADDPGDDFLRRLLHQLGASEADIEVIYNTYMRRFMRGELTEAEYWDELRQNYGLAIHDTISEEFKNWRGLIKNDAVLALVETAKTRNLQTAVFTNVIEPTYNVLHAAGYYDYFDVTIASCKVGFAKPQPEMYELALRMMHTTADHSLLVDDKQKNLNPAIKLGFHTILAKNPEQIISDVTQAMAGAPA